MMYQGCNFITILQGMQVFKDACLVQGNLFGSSGDLCLTSRNNSTRLIPDWSEVGQHSRCNVLLEANLNCSHSCRCLAARLSDFQDKNLGVLRLPSHLGDVSIQQGFRDGSLYLLFWLFLLLWLKQGLFFPIGYWLDDSILANLQLPLCHHLSLSLCQELCFFLIS